MRTRVFARLLFVALSAVSGFSQNHFPNGLKDVYIYSYQNLEITDKVIGEHGDWRLHSEFGGFGQKWLLSKQNSLYFYDLKLNKEKLLVRFDDPVGSSYEIGLSSCAQRSIIGAKDLTIEVPAGIFSDVVRLDFKGSCADAGISSHFYAEGIGLVKVTAASIQGMVSAPLIRATVDNRTYPRPVAGTTVSGFSDRYVYTIDGGPYKGSQPTTAGVEMTVQNLQASDLVVKYTSTCRFGWELVNESGEVVQSLLQDKICGSVFTQDVIKPNEYRSFKSDIPLFLKNAQEGQLLPLEPGRYTVRMFSTGDISWSATVPVVVKHSR